MRREIWGHATNMIEFKRIRKKLPPHPQETLGRSYAKQKHHPGTHYFPWQKGWMKGSLVGGFKYFFFHHYLGKRSNLTNIFPVETTT